MQELRSFEAKADFKDLQGWTIPKGTVVHVMKEGPIPPNPKMKRVLLVRIDNGTGHLDMMPETAIYEQDVSA